MLYVISYVFKSGAGEKRAQVRDQHLAHLAGAEERLKVAGPLMEADNSDEATGSIIIIEAQSQTAATLFSDTDPYVQAGIVESVSIAPWKAVVGGWAS